MSLRFGRTRRSHLPLDRPLTVADFPDPKENEASRSRTKVIVGYVRRAAPDAAPGCSPSSRARAATSCFEGTPEQVANLIQDWIKEGGADGFNLIPPVLPEMARPLHRACRSDPAKTRPIPNRPTKETRSARISACRGRTCAYS